MNSQAVLGIGRSSQYEGACTCPPDIPSDLPRTDSAACAGRSQSSKSRCSCCTPANRRKN